MDIMDAPISPLPRSDARTSLTLRALLPSSHFARLWKAASLAKPFLDINVKDAASAVTGEGTCPPACQPLDTSCHDDGKAISMDWADETAPTGSSTENENALLSLGPAPMQVILPDVGVVSSRISEKSSAELPWRKAADGVRTVSPCDRADATAASNAQTSAVLQC